LTTLQRGDNSRQLNAGPNLRFEPFRQVREAEQVMKNQGWLSHIDSSGAAKAVFDEKVLLFRMAATGLGQQSATISRFVAGWLLPEFRKVACPARMLAAGILLLRLLAAPPSR